MTRGLPAERTNGTLLLCRHCHINDVPHRPFKTMAGHNYRSKPRIVEGYGGRGRAVQQMQGHARPPEPGPLRCTSEPRGISGKGGNGSAVVIGEETAMERMTGAVILGLPGSCSSGRSAAPFNHISKILFSF